jgi:hypothetical protein
MGNLGATAIDPWHVNLVNPASYSYLQATSFEVGLDASYKQLGTASANENIYKGNINYFALGLPLLNPINDALERVKRTYDIGLMFALKPHSTVGYDVISTEDHPDEGIVQRKYIGDGGTYKFLTGLSGRYENFSLGINAGYLFGKISYASLVYFQDLNYAYNNDFNESFSVSGFTYNVGASYSIVLNKAKLDPETNVQPNKIVLGIYGNSSTKFNTVSDVFYGGVLTSISAGNLNFDTLYVVDGAEGSGRLPSNIGFGIAYHHAKKIMGGINFEYNFWSQYKNEGKLVEDQLKDGYSLSGGLNYVPDYQSYTSAFDRMNYRVGFYYRTDGRSENDKQFTEAAINLGLGVPFVFKRKTSNVDFMLSIGKSMSERLISESFVKFGVGLTFNDQEWFIKRKYY